MSNVLVVKDENDKLYVFTSVWAMTRWAKVRAKFLGLPNVEYEPWDNELWLFDDGYATAYTYEVQELTPNPTK